MTSLMMPAPAAATMTTMTNTAPIAVTQPGVGKPDVAKIGFITNNRQGKTNTNYCLLFKTLGLSHDFILWIHLKMINI